MHFGLASLVMCVFALGLAVGVVIAVGMLLVFQLRGIAHNRTGIEDWILEKAKYRRFEGDPDFEFPYDLGSTRRNMAQVLSRTCAPIGDGIVWETRAGCDQYTLTVEQIAQKAEKRARTRTYTISKPVSGSWLPLWSQGWAVCTNPPYTDEPRIRLDVGDVVKVSRWKTYDLIYNPFVIASNYQSTNIVHRHWLFGDKLSKDRDSNGSTSSGHLSSERSRCRGWFPRRCAVELVEPNSAEHQRHFNDKQKGD